MPCVERILQVELDQAGFGCVHLRKATPAPTTDEIAQGMEARTPILWCVTVARLRSSLVSVLRLGLDESEICELMPRAQA